MVRVGKAWVRAFLPTGWRRKITVLGRFIGTM